VYAMVVMVDIDTERLKESEELLQSFTIPMAKSQAGFQRGLWMRSTSDSEGRGVVLFDSQEHAEAAAKAARQGPPPGAPVSIRSVDVFQILAEA
jgi:hypothetical protein